MIDWIIRLLAGLFATFKMKNPAVAAIVLLILSVVTYTATQGSLLGVVTLPEWASSVVTMIGLFLTAVTGSQTTKFLNPQTNK